MSINISANLSANLSASAILSAYHNDFQLPAEISAACSIYKMLKWNAGYFLENWKSNIGTVKAGCILRYNNLYHVSFTANCSLNRIKEAYAADTNLQLSLSFRKMGNMPAVVIVSF